MTKYKIIELITQLLAFNSKKEGNQQFLDLTLFIKFD